MDSRRQICRVVSDYEAAYPDAWVLVAGEVLTASDRTSEWPGWVWCTQAGGKSGWVPASFLDRKGSACTARRDYDATELTVRAGETLTTHQAEAGWLWCTNEQGQSGWVPAEHLDCPPIG